MQLDQISASIRRRTLWEGVDLGFAMARRWFLPLWGLWWLTALPTSLLAAALLYWSPTAATLVVWWCKPVYEPMLLFWLSRRLFGEQLSWREALGEWRQVLRPRLLSNLTIRRLSTNRSFYMPVSHLEGLKGAERLKRLRLLGNGHSTGTWLTICGAHLELALEMSFLLLVLYLIPRELAPGEMLDMLLAERPLVVWLTTVGWLLATSIIAPFYVAAGFALYLTRRSELEAWDLELAFRRMAPRFRGTHLSGAIAALTLALAIYLPAPPALAVEGSEAPATEQAATEQDAAPSPALTREDARRAITAVMQEPDFGEKHTVRTWRYIGKKQEKRDENKEKPQFDFTWVRYLADFAEYALWVAGAVLLGWVLLSLLRLTDWLPRTRARRAAAPPTTLFGLPVTPDSLPDDVPAAVQALLAEKRLRAALSLLYRATLVHLMHVRHVKIPDSATEGECGRIVTEQRPPVEAAFFARLTRAWVWCAYGHVAPAAADVAAIAGDWNAIYGGGRTDE